MGLKSGSPRPFDDLKRKEIVEIPYEVGVEGVAEKKSANCNKLEGKFCENCNKFEKTECMCKKWKGKTGWAPGPKYGINYEKTCKDFL